MKTIIEQLEESGYIRYKDYSELAQNLYQKGHTDEKGVKYFINCYEIGIDEVSYQFDVQLSVNGCAINIETVQWFFSENKWNHRVNTLNTVETMVEIIWQSLKADYYEEYNG